MINDPVKHVGDYIDAASDIIDFIDALTDFFPTEQIAWSFILPQPGILHGIRIVNNAVSTYCDDNNIDLIWAKDLSVFANGLTTARSLFAHDGVHLNRKGIDIMSNTIKDYIFSIYKY